MSVFDIYNNPEYEPQVDGNEIETHDIYNEEINTIDVTRLISAVVEYENENKRLRQELEYQKQLCKQLQEQIIMNTSRDCDDEDNDEQVHRPKLQKPLISGGGIIVKNKYESPMQIYIREHMNDIAIISHIKRSLNLRNEPSKMLIRSYLILCWRNKEKENASKKSYKCNMKSV